jgi:ribosomal protein S27AE
MGRYIDINTLLNPDNIIVVQDETGIDEFPYTYTDAVKVETILNAPTADVVEVRHGYWKDRYENKYANHYYECSVCGGAALDGIKNNGLGNPESIQVLSDFCPRCGAKMDGERKAEND